MRFPLLASIFALGCADINNGTAVGNPGHLDVYVQNVPEDVALTSARFRVAAIELVGCDRDVAILQLDKMFDALGPSPVLIPGGQWCSTVVLPDGEDSFILEGFDGNGKDFTVSLSPEAFVLEGAYEIDGNQVLVALALSQHLQENLAEGVDTGVDGPPPPAAPGGPFEPALVVPEGLYLDDDVDGRVSGDTLAAVPAESDDCGCASTSAPSWAVIALAGILGWRRRRAHPHRPA